MTDDEVQVEVLELRKDVDEIKRRLSDLHDLPEGLATLAGKVSVLSEFVIEKLDNMAPRVERAASIKTAIQFASVVLVPVLVALIGGYFALRTGASG